MTIKEVAALAGVSPAAVSRYMNGGSISPEKSERIRKVIRDTGYRPNPMAQTMRTGKGGQIGIIVPRVYSDSVSQILSGIADRLREKSYMTMLGVTNADRDRELRYLETMQNNQVAGIILMGTVMTPFLRDAIRESSKPVVVTGQNFAGVHCIYHDDFGAVKELGVRMIAKGRKHVAYIGAADEDVAAGKQRRLGMEDAWKEAGLPAEDLVEAKADFTAESGRSVMKDLLLRHPELDGVICATDRMALGAMQAIQQAGKKIPQDISIAGVGDSWADTITTPQLTSVHLYYRQCGTAAADVLLGLIEHEGEAGPVVQTRLEFTVVERESL